MNLSEYLSVLKERWRIITVLVVVVTAAAAVVTYLMTPTYEARSQVFVSFQPSDGSSTSSLLSGSTYTQNQISSYVDLATSPAILEPAIQELGLTQSAAELAELLTVTSPPDTVLIDVVASAEEPGVAADVANAVAASLALVIPEMERPQDAETSPVRLSVVRTAVAPFDPATPNIPLNLGAGLVAGLLMGVGAAVVRQALDTKIRSERDIAAVTDAAVIGTIGFDDDASAHPLIVQTSPKSQRSEAFRRLRTNLQFLDTGAPGRAIVVTSAVPGEGKSTTAINLAISLADAGQRVVLVDADLRRPAVADYMGLEREVGLTTVLIGKAGLDDVVQPWGNSRLHVVTSGQIPPNPSELLGSHAMSTLIKELVGVYDVVLLDTAPLLPVTDGAILARITAGALLVAGADKIHQTQLAQAVGSLSTVDARLLGVVLNRLARRESDSYTYYDYATKPDVKKSRWRKEKARSAPPTPPSAPQADAEATETLSREPWAEPAEEERGRRAKTWPGHPMHQRRR